MTLEINVAESWQDVTIGQFAELYPVLNSKQDKVTKTLSILSVISGTPIDDLKKIKNTTESLLKLRTSLAFLNTLGQLEEEAPTPSFYIGSRRFSYSPNLHEMTAGQYITLTELLKGVSEDHGKLYNRLHTILACLIKEDQRNELGQWVEVDWDGDDFAANAELFRERLTMDKAYPLGVFFCKVWRELMDSMDNYLNKQIIQAERKIQEARTLTGGAGT